MQFLIMMYPNSDVLAALPEDERNAVFAGHGTFMEKIKASGEFVGTVALAGTDQSSVVSVRSGATTVTDGPFSDAKVTVGGTYIVDVKDRERAHELAALIPDAAVEGLGIEVRPIVFADIAAS